MKRIILTVALILTLIISGCASAEPAAVEAGFSEADLVIVVGDDTYRIREDSAPLLEALGGDYDYSEMLSCVYEGQDKKFTYPGLIVSTVPVEGKDVSEVFTFTDATYSTSKGIKVGDTKDAIITAYGENFFDDGYITYSTTNDPSDIQAERIQFQMSGDVIDTIYIYSPSY